MKSFTRHRGLAVPLDRAHVDTDQIIPKQFLKSIERTGFGPHLFDGWRYLDEGTLGKPAEARRPDPDFVLNQPRYRGASILLARRNFGCGSSREHAAWALGDYGIRAIIAPGFADIFYNNCFGNGLLPVVLSEDQVEMLFHRCQAREGFELCVDLEAREIRIGNELFATFELDEFRRRCLLQGLDEIGTSLAQAADIAAYEDRRRAEAPWLFGSDS